MSQLFTKVSVFGTSMYPSLLPGDCAIVTTRSEYPLGSILVYQYKDEGYIIHRLLKIDSNCYYCKGDNAFRIERISESDVKGTIIFVIRNNIKFSPKQMDATFCNMSLKIGYKFIRSKYNSQEVTNSSLYKQYKSRLFSLIDR